ncbi:hypothetical protein OVA06_03525 [Pseudarthrobacter sp. SL88]|uniref:hypothetical protein n=1 Tax=Pseudarthrobacter sp. SL88 TaxID=2994666 RepID=UPI00227338CC|nr:hypothetical protein [Pseudarthrobacter sp. SL88]MCY1673795.1 hypothetical protein [Pseudarthrobacter sp. SL88]
MNEELESKESGFSRRRVVAGVAWSLPVIATAIASPAAAASGDPIVTLAAPIPVTISGATAAAGTAPISFDIQAGAAFKGDVVTYRLTIEGVSQNQKALISLVSVSPGSGNTSIPNNSKLTNFDGSIATSPGNQFLRVNIGGFKYSGTVTKGTFSYTVTLTVTIGSASIVKTSTISVTYA